MDPVILYVKNNCVACDATKRRLLKLKVPYRPVNMDEDSAALAAVKRMGFKEAPVVFPPESSGLKAWSGYRPDLLKKLTT